MASELLEMGLTMQEIEDLACFKDKSLTSPDKNKPKPVKKEPKKRGKYSKDSDSDSSYESGDRYDFPRGVHNGINHVSMGIIGGRGKPFNPSTNSYPGQASGLDQAYNQFNRMHKEIYPLLQNTCSAIFRNDVLEEKYNKTNITNGANGIVESDITSIGQDLPICSEKEIPVAKIKEPTRELSVQTEKKQEKTAPTNKEPEKSYLDVVNRNMDQSNFGPNSESRCNVDDRRKKDVKLKTQLYIPPHMRNRMAQSSSTSSTSISSVDMSSSSILSEVSSNSEKATHYKNCDTEKLSTSMKVNQETFQEPSNPKKTVAELCKKNVLLSGLLKKKKAAVQSTSSSTAQSNVSTPTSMSLVDVSSISTLSQDTSTPDKPYHHDYYDIDPCINHNTDPAPVSSSFPDNLVDFNYLEPPPHLLASPLAPPPEFEDSDEETHCYFDPETKDYVTYRIPRKPVDHKEPMDSENGFSSAQSCIGTSIVCSDFSHEKSVPGKSQLRTPLKSNTGPATHGHTSNNIHPSLLMSFATRPGSAFSTVTPRHSPGILPGPPINPESAVNYATASRGFRPDPGEEGFDEAYPPLK